MSLLLEALKKAELAKQQVNQPADTLVEPALSLEPRESIITREELPDIARAIEITPEYSSNAPAATVEPDLPPVQVRPAAPPEIRTEPAFEPQPIREMTPEPPPETIPSPVMTDMNSGRDAARQLFDVKEVDYNPRRPFYITLAVLGLAAAGYGGHLWWQLQPKALVNTAAIKDTPKGGQPPSPETPPPAGQAAPDANAAAPGTPQPLTAAAPATAASAPAPAPQAVPAQGAAAKAQPTLAPGPAEPPPGAPKGPTFVRGGQPAPAGAPPAAAPPQPVASAASAASAPQRAAPRAPRAPRPPITVNPPSIQPDVFLEQAYEAYQKGDLGNARENYLKVLQREPSNRDALLGLAAIDLRTGNVDTAEARYLKLLELDPRDTLAQSGLISLRGGSGDAVQTESRLKTLIASHPDATHLQFTLGNQYAVQGRWREAQDAYFKAYSAEPENPDFAFNLAIALDQLRQAKIAIEYYRKALALAAKRPAAFDTEKAKIRIWELER